VFVPLDGLEVEVDTYGGITELREAPMEIAVHQSCLPNIAITNQEQLDKEIVVPRSTRHGFQTAILNGCN
jgi:hypothetical protein